MTRTLSPPDNLASHVPVPPAPASSQPLAAASRIKVVRPMSLIDLMLDEQQDLSAVDHFSLRHESGALPAHTASYSILLPTAPPGPGQQYAFDVDLDRCSGCKACVTACHTLNGLDEHETWRDVGLLIGGTSTQPVVQHVTAACHHCLEPACLAACPVNAYEKDPVTGIVKHLDDQCFGCQYCTLACPYDVPKYSRSKGIVRKCDMCSDRLASGEAPACVQACPHQAIAIRVVDCGQVREDSEASTFLPAAPDSQLTFPTTNYRTRHPFPRNLLPADYYSVSLQHPHLPLILMLVLTQLSVGAFLAGQILLTGLTVSVIAVAGHSPAWPDGQPSDLTASVAEAVHPLLSLIALMTGLLALAASTLHLGRPQYAFRAILGLRHSWLSREILCFGIFAKLAVLSAAGHWFGPDLPLWTPSLQNGIGWSVAVTGLAGVLCSVMIYAVTGRPLWSFSSTASRFGLTTLLLGAATLWLTLTALAAADVPAATAIVAQHGLRLSQTLLLLGTLKLVIEATLFRHRFDRQVTALKRSALLMSGPLVRITVIRFLGGLLGGVLLPTSLLSRFADSSAAHDSSSLAMSAALMFAALLMGELLERYLFFAAVAAPRMPGSLR